MSFHGSGKYDKSNEFATSEGLDELCLHCGLRKGRHYNGECDPGFELGMVRYPLPIIDVELE